MEFLASGLNKGSLSSVIFLWDIRDLVGIYLIWWLWCCQRAVLGNAAEEQHHTSKACGLKFLYWAARVHIYLSIHLSIHPVCVCIYIYTHTHMHTHTHLYTGGWVVISVLWHARTHAHRTLPTLTPAGCHVRSAGGLALLCSTLCSVFYTLYLMSVNIPPRVFCFNIL